MFQMSEKKITAVVGAIFLQHYCLIMFSFFLFFFLSSFLDPLKLT